MKRLLIALCLMLSFAGIATAQQAPKKTAKKVATAEVKKDAAASSATPLKADGTPDKRFKANKKAAVEKPLKKDGTPDKRFKANKKG